CRRDGAVHDCGKSQSGHEKRKSERQTHRTAAGERGRKTDMPAVCVRHAVAKKRRTNMCECHDGQEKRYAYTAIDLVRSSAYPRWCNSVRKRKVIGVFIAVLVALMLITIQYYMDKMIWGPALWHGFWIYVIFIGVWLIVTLVLVIKETTRN